MRYTWVSNCPGFFNMRAYLRVVRLWCFIRPVIVDQSSHSQSSMTGGPVCFVCAEKEKKKSTYRRGHELERTHEAESESEKWRAGEHDITKESERNKNNNVGCRSSALPFLTGKGKTEYGECGFRYVCLCTRKHLGSSTSSSQGFTELTLLYKLTSLALTCTLLGSARAAAASESPVQIKV